MEILRIIAPVCEIVSIIMDVYLSESDYAKIVKIICLFARILIFPHYSKR